MADGAGVVCAGLMPWSRAIMVSTRDPSTFGLTMRLYAGFGLAALFERGTPIRS